MPRAPSFELIDALVFRRWWMQMEFTGRPMRGRFLVRQGGNGWMVYDSELKGPAQIEKNGAFAEKLTKEQAETLAKLFTTRDKKDPSSRESAEAGK
ncbi:hypothetical protein DXU07_07030 [Bradyrhizobium elkanii]